jgi:hypothetical protein
MIGVNFGGSKPGISPLSGDLEDIRSGKRFASAQYEDGFSKLYNLINEMLGFFGCKLTFGNRGGGSSPAVYAV